MERKRNATRMDATTILARLQRVAGPAIDDDRWWCMGVTTARHRAFLVEVTDGSVVLAFRVTVRKVAPAPVPYGIPTEGADGEG